MAGRIIGAGGHPDADRRRRRRRSAGPGRPAAPSRSTSIVDADTTLNLPSITTGYQLGPDDQRVGDRHRHDHDGRRVHADRSQTPPAVAATPTAIEGTIAPDGAVGDAAGDLALARRRHGQRHAADPGRRPRAVQEPERHGDSDRHAQGRDAHLLRRATGDWFHFNQRERRQVPIAAIMKGSRQHDDRLALDDAVTLFRALMITYYVDNTTTPGTPRLTRLVNHFTPQALAGVVEDLDLTYDLVDGVNNPTGDHVAAVHGRRRRRDLQLEPDSEGQHPRRRAVGGRCRSRRRTTSAITSRRRWTCAAWRASIATTTQ